MEALESRQLLSAAALDIIVVTELGDADPIAAYLEQTFYNIGSLTTGSFNSADTSGSQQQSLSGADLIVVSPDADDDRYDGSDAEVDFWSNLAVPIIVLDAQFARDNRWNWIDSTSYQPVTDASETVVLVGVDALFDGVTVSGGKADLFDVGGVGGDVGPWVVADSSQVGGGLALGTGQTAGGATAIGLARWDAGDALIDGSMGTATEHGGPRVLFGIGALDALTADGQRVLANALKSHGLIDEPQYVTQGDAYTVFSDVPWSETAATGVRGNDAAFVADPALVEAVVVTPPSHGLLDLAADGSFTYTPDAGYTGADSFVYQLTDGQSGSDPVEVALTVEPNPAELVVTIKQVLTGRQLGLTPLEVGALLQLDPYDDDEPIASVMSFSPGLVGSTILQTTNADIYYHGPATDHGTDPSQYVRLHLNQNATVYVSYDRRFAHLPDWLGPDHGWWASSESFDGQQVFARSFEAGDLWLGANDKPVAGFTEWHYRVAIKPLGDAPINNAPYAYRDYYDVAGGASLTVNAAAGVTANDTDPEADALTVSLTKAPLFGDVTLNPDGSFIYTPGPQFTRYDSFQYQVGDGQSAGNVAIVNILNGQEVDDSEAGSHGGDEAKQNEHHAVFALAPHHAATHIAVAPGDWTDPAVWQGGLLPIDRANVLIPQGVTVTVGGVIAQTPATVRVEGTLRFAPDVDTELRADTVLIDTTGYFEMGTSAAPIAPGVTARLVAADLGEIDRVWDPHALSRGLVSHGHVSMVGQPATPFLAVTQNPTAGQSQITLAAAPVNWQVGDTIVIAGTSASGTADNEVRTIQAIEGNVVTVDPLQDDHTPPIDGLYIHVAHLDRNVVVTSQSTDDFRRGHVMFMHSSDVQVHHARFHDLGRTRKAERVDDNVVVADGYLVPGSGTNSRARYSVHFHRTGGAASPASVTGSVVTGGIGWGFVNHSSHANLDGNVAFDINGAGFVAEAGDEVGAFTNNIALGITGVGGSPADRDDIHDFAFQGDGFWFQSPGVGAENNVAAGVRRQGFVIWTEGLKEPGIGRMRFPAALLDDPSIANGATTVDPQIVPFHSFVNNTAYGAYAGLRTQFHIRFGSHDGRTQIVDFLAWNILNGISSHYTKHTDVRDARLLNDITNPAGDGFEVNDVSDDMDFYNMTMVGFDDGFEIPRRGDNLIEGGVLHNRVNIFGDRRRETDRSLTVRGTQLLVLEGNLGFEYHLRLGAPLAAYEYTFDHVFRDEGVYFEDALGNVQQVWHPEQAGDFIPFPFAQMGLPDEYVGLTNQQLWDQFGIAVGGEVAPAGPFMVPGILGLVTGMPYFMADGPDAADDPVTLDEDSGSTVINPLANDFDPDADPLTIADITQPLHGTAVNHGDMISYTPNLHFNGSDSFTYIVTDGRGGIDIATIHLTVRSVNDAPVIAAWSVQVDEDEAVIIAALDGSIDADGDTLTITGVSQGEHGLVTTDGATITYTPQDDYHGPDAFTYTVSDGQGGVVQNTIDVLVRSVNDAPVAADDQYTTTLDHPLRIGTRQSVALIPAGAVWSYLDDGSDQGTAWRGATFDDTAWPAGPAQLGYGDGDETTVIGFVDTDPNTSGTQRNATTYFRHRFDVGENLGLVTHLTVRMLRDDGAAVFLNGVEIVRDDLAADAPYNGFATATAAGAEEDTYYEFAIDLSTLPVGTLAATGNVLAVEVHQAAASSSDVSFDLELDATLTYPGSVIDNDTDVDGDALQATLIAGPAHGSLMFHPDGSFDYVPDAGFTGDDSFTYRVLDDGLYELVSTGHEWAYLDTGASPGLAWEQFSYDDGLWRRGPSQLGYGDGDEATRVNYIDADPGASGTQKNAATYFRTQFTIDNRDDYSGFVIRLLRDDAAAVFVNGVEVYRDATLPANADHLTYAAASVGNENAYITIVLDDGLLLTGNNLIAAEVHQSGPTSSDMSFDLILAASRYSQPAVVTIHVLPDGLRGDFNRDGAVDGLDVELLYAALRNGLNDAIYDLNGDSTVGPGDFDELLAGILDVSRADFNLDGRVDISDLSTLAVHFGRTAGVQWGHGDASLDGRVDITDLSYLASRFGQLGGQGGGAASDEPATSPDADATSIAVAPRNDSPGPAVYSWSHIRSILDATEGDEGVRLV